MRNKAERNHSMTAGRYSRYILIFMHVDIQISLLKASQLYVARVWNSLCCSLSFEVKIWLIKELLVI